MSYESGLRGYKAIQRIVSKIKDSSKQISHGRRTCTTMYIARRDYNLIRRWPHAAKLLEIEMSAKVMTWRNFKILAGT